MSQQARKSTSQSIGGAGMAQEDGASTAKRRTVWTVALSVFVTLGGVAGIGSIGTYIYKAGRDAGARDSSGTIATLREQRLEALTKASAAETDVRTLKDILVAKDEQIRFAQSQRQQDARNRFDEATFLKERLV